MILLEDVLSLFISVGYNKKKILISTILNIIDFNGMFRLTDPINAVLPIPNLKLVNLTVFLSSWIKISNYCNITIWLMPLVNWVEAFELISNLLNLILLYCKLVDKLKM